MSAALGDTTVTQKQGEQLAAILSVVLCATALKVIVEMVLRKTAQVCAHCKISNNNNHYFIAYSLMDFSK